MGSLVRVALAVLGAGGPLAGRLLAATVVLEDEVCELLGLFAYSHLVITYFFSN